MSVAGAARPAALEAEPLRGADLDRRLLADHRRARRQDLALQALLPLVVIVPVALVWQWAGSRPGNILLPTFTKFASSVVHVALSGEFWAALLNSETALVVGFGAAVLVGIPLGLGMGRLRFLESVVDPYLNIALVTPMALVMPILMMIFGLTLTARAVVIFTFSFVFIVVPCRAGVLTIPPRLWEMCRSFGASEWQLWRELLIPGSLPALMTGLRQGFAHALTGMLVAELTLLAVGVGRLILTYQDAFEEDSVFAIVFLLIVQSVLAMLLLRYLERRVGGMSRITEEESS